MRRTGSGSDLVCGDWLVGGGDDGAGETTGVGSGAAVHDIRAGLRAKAIFLFGGPFVQVGVVGFAATCHGHVEHRALGVLAEHGLGGVGGDPFGAVHGDRVAVGDVLAYIAVEECASSVVIESAGDQSVIFAVDLRDAPALPVAHRVVLGGRVIGVAQWN